MLAENPLAFQVLYPIKYIGNSTYFIWDAMARLLKTSGLASGNTNLTLSSHGHLKSQKRSYVQKW